MQTKIFDFFKLNKPEIDNKIKELLINNQNDLSLINKFGSESIDKLLEFSTNGKGIRGAMVILGALMYEKEINEDIITIAAVMEITHSALLILDDITDDDRLRRGKPTIFYQYVEDAQKNNIDNPYFYGQNMGMYVGVIAIYLAIKIITETNLDETTKNKLINLLTNEISQTGVAQMQDCFLGFDKNTEFNIDDIRKVYLYKTGRYTFSLPMILGATIANAENLEIELIQKFGETLGIVFQLVDDNISIYSDSSESGKPVGNDIRVNKKTFIRNILYSKSNETQIQELNKIFGKLDLELDDIKKVREIIQLTGTKAIIDEYNNDLSQKALAIIEDLDISKDYKEIMNSLVEFNKMRTK